MNDTTGFSLMELFVMGGIFMWPLLLFSVAAVAIALERGVYLLYHNLKLDDLREKVGEAVKHGNIKEAKKFLEGRTRRRMGARILLTLVNRSGSSEHRLEKAVEAEAMNCIASLENGFSLLTALGSLSPLTGFLGTVSGMIGAFKSISEATDVNAQIVANGIYEALITTVFGLIIAIIAMSAHSIFSHIVDKFASEVEIVCSDLIIEITESKAEAPAEPAGNEKKKKKKRRHGRDQRLQRRRLPSHHLLSGDSGLQHQPGFSHESAGQGFHPPHPERRSHAF
jgi:biopolymer transport protein ExbB